MGVANLLQKQHEGPPNFGCRLPASGSGVLRSRSSTSSPRPRTSPRRLLPTSAPVPTTNLRQQLLQHDPPAQGGGRSRSGRRLRSVTGLGWKVKLVWFIILPHKYKVNNTCKIKMLMKIYFNFCQ